ncbi:MAG TPA: bifunctional 4-hydroxy-2-oxoglutarate aldolase/2-dehydro-3-deoxy-phosphogluconate aldolase, partial [Spirochaetia bacterium]|nr:bifunctional 4-hydroxy-2-oxoglutarate aldolase/2-dehydro-3-deoxy-phosphogluconate aldolase [Spirochaetia bacterium]
GVVPIFYEPDPAIAKKITAALAMGGAPLVEMTNRGDHALDVFRELEQYCRAEHPEVVLGVGSVVDAPTAALYIAAGANFIVSPLLDRETALLCNARKICYIPGCATPTEIHQAELLGVEICKLFPGDAAGGPGFVKALRGPCPWTRLVITGGVDSTRESLSAWFDAGAAAVGMGSKLIVKELVKKKDFAGIEATMRTTLEIVREIKNGRKK